MDIKKGFKSLLEILALADGDAEAVEKAGARHSAADTASIQTMRDSAVSLGAKCSTGTSKAASTSLSFDDITDAIYQALKALAPASPITIDSDFYMPGYYVEDLYIDRVVFCWPDGKTYEATYTIDGTSAVLAPSTEWKEVYEGWIYAKQIATGVAKAEGDSAEAPLVFIASGAFMDRDREWSSRDMLEPFAKGINDGSIQMSVDWFHTGFKSRSNPKPNAEPIILGHIAKAAFENDHLALMPIFDDPAIEAIVRKEAEADALGLSIWFSGVQRSEDRAFHGKPSSRASVALLPRGYESYPYTSIKQE